ncbi:MAG TPA: hypothetical protein ENK49_10425 [Gammaproteobacteria bacterium]|nr:hypothetical protein [Gammaproteobacteria bacterium]
MKSLVLQPTEVAQWHALVSEAQLASHRNLEEGIESYLVFLLMRFADRPELARRIMALEFLRAQQEQGQRTERLRDVGDQCLLFSGLFPQIAERRQVKVSYFVALGRSAYDQLATIVDRQSDQLYTRLTQAFVGIMDVLHAMRGLSGQPVLDPLAAAELWAETGSQSAYQAISPDSGAVPAPPGQFSRRSH